MPQETMPSREELIESIANTIIINCDIKDCYKDGQPIPREITVINCIKDMIRPMIESYLG